jgi:gluconolactonase
MRKLIILATVLLSACSTKTKEVKTTGSIERTDPALNEIIDEDATIEILAEGYDWSEGPVWVEKENMLLFSDVPENIVYKWTEEKGAEIFLTPSGYTGISPRGGEEGSNGLTLNKDGQLVLCQHGDRRVAVLNSDFKNPKPEFRTLAGDFNGKKFNSPNDLVFDKQGNLYFTDPPYGLVNQMNDSTKEIPFQGVYKVKPDGTVILLVDSLTRPNGIGLSPDDKTLYIANSDRPKAKWYAFELQGDSIVSGKIFFSTDYVEGEKGSPDGFKVSRDGTIFSSGPGGIWIFSPSANVLGKIKLPEAAANCALSSDEKTLYITNDMYLLRVKMRK